MRSNRIKSGSNLTYQKQFRSIDYVRENVDIRLTMDLIEVYFKEVRIASHKRRMAFKIWTCTNSRCDS
jgi:hypothetical protein